MDKERYRLSSKRVRQLVGKQAGAPSIVSAEERIYSSQCVHCGATLPHDVGFQEYHMLKEHGLEV